MLLRHMFTLAVILGVTSCHSKPSSSALNVAFTEDESGTSYLFYARTFEEKNYICRTVCDEGHKVGLFLQDEDYEKCINKAAVVELDVFANDPKAAGYTRRIIEGSNSRENNFLKLVDRPFKASIEDPEDDALAKRICSEGVALTEEIIVKTLLPFQDRAKMIASVRSVSSPVSFSRRQDLALVMHEDKIIILNTKKREKALSIPGTFTRAQFSPDEKSLYLATEKKLSVVKTEDGSVTKEISLPFKEMEDVQVIGTKALVLVGSLTSESGTGYVRKVYAIPSLEELPNDAAVLRSGDGRSNIIATRDGKYLLGRSGPKKIMVTLATDASVVLEKEIEYFYSPVGLASDDRTLVFRGGRQILKLNVETGEDKVLNLPAKADPYDGPDLNDATIVLKEGNLLATPSKVGGLVLISLEDGSTRLIDVPCKINKLLSMINGYILVSDSSDKVAVVDAKSGRSLIEFSLYKLMKDSEIQSDFSTRMNPDTPTTSFSGKVFSFGPLFQDISFFFHLDHLKESP